MNILAACDGYVWARNDAGELVESYVGEDGIAHDIDQKDYVAELVRRAREKGVEWTPTRQLFPGSTEYANVAAFINELAREQQALIPNA